MKPLCCCLTAVLMLCLISVVLAEDSPVQTPQVQAAPAPEHPAAPAAATPEPPAEPAPEPIVLPDPDKLVATVNGVNITEGDVEKRFQQSIETIKERNDIGDQEINQLRKRERKSVINALIKAILLQQEAKNDKVELTQADIDKENEKYIKVVMKRNHWTREQLEAEVMKKYGVTVEESLKQFSQKPLFRESVLVEKLYRHKFPGDLDVTDEEIQKFYDASKPNRYDTPEMVRASQIVIKVDKNSTPEEKQQARQKIDEILLKAKEPGADFAALAKTYSQGPAAKHGGDLGFFPKKTDSMAEPVVEAAFALKPGNISDVIETPDGYSIIKVTARKAPVVIPLEQARDEIAEQLGYLKRKKKINRWVDDLVKAAAVTYANESDKPTPPIKVHFK